MKMKKKVLSVFAAFVMLLNFTACDTEDSNRDETESTVSSAESEAMSDETDTADETAAAGIVSAHGKLSVSGADIVDKDGNPYQLRGMSTHGIQWFPQYVNKDIIKELRDDWNTNVFRLAMYTGDSEGYDESTKEEVEKYVEDGVDACIELDMYCIIDWHVLGDKTPMLKKDEALAFFEKFSRKYGDKDNIIYEICNEPNNPAQWGTDIKPYAEEVIPVIRANDPDAIIIVGTPQWSQLLDEPRKDPLAGDNIMYALHFYSDTHKDWLRDTLTRCYQDGLPVFVSEFGMCDSSGAGANNFEETEKWLSLLDSCNISYINWAVADKDETVCVLKPGTDPAGGWTEDDLTEGGIWIRNFLRSKDPVI